jgi:hypothetical protein
MQLAELLPHLKQLSYTDKLQVLHFLTSELFNDAGLTAVGQQNQEEVFVPKEHNSFEAAAVLTKALEEHRAAING